MPKGRTPIAAYPPEFHRIFQLAVEGHLTRLDFPDYRDAQHHCHQLNRYRKAVQRDNNPQLQQFANDIAPIAISIRRDDGGVPSARPDEPCYLHFRLRSLPSYLRDQIADIHEKTGAQPTAGLASASSISSVLHSLNYQDTPPDLGEPDLNNPYLIYLNCPNCGEYPVSTRYLTEENGKLKPPSTCFHCRNSHPTITHTLDSRRGPAKE